MGSTAETSPSLGYVRKVEETIQITAPIVSGNSGGPLVDTEGRVLGVATRTKGDTSLGVCIQVCRILPLLPSVSELIERADRHVREDRGELAAGLFALAELKGPSVRQREKLQALRAQIAGSGAPR